MGGSRIKPVGLILSDIRQVEGALAEIAAIDRKCAEITNFMNETIDKVKAHAETASVSLMARHKELCSAIKVFATLNEDTVFEKGKKSRDLAFGIIGFRASTEIKQMNKISAETTLQRLHEFGFKEAITNKESLLKSAMTSWTDEKLQSVGLKKRLKNEFYIEVKAEELKSA